MPIPYHLTQDERRTLETERKRRIRELASSLPPKAQQEIRDALDAIQLSAFDRGVCELSQELARVKELAA